MNLRSLARIAAFAIALAPVFRTAAAQDSLPKIRFVVMDDYVRDVLSADWDAHRVDHPLLERAYCLGYQLDFWAQELAYRVTQIEKPEPDSIRFATNSSISFTCNGKFPGHLAELHVHPAESCLSSSGPCFPSGPYAWQCLASDADVRHLAYVAQPFHMIQCTREGVVYIVADSSRTIRLGNK